MNLYLSSFRMGDHVNELLNMIDQGRIGVIQNALDYIPMQDRIAWSEKNFSVVRFFQENGFEADDLDLRDYFSKQDLLRERMKQYKLIWAVGGNSFLLRRAMRQSGFDQLIKPFLENDENIYGGWSAGVCVAGPSLNGIELMDQPHEICGDYAPEPVWDGLGLIDKLIIPHYQSPGHRETEDAERAVNNAIANHIPYMAMRDGDVLIQRGEEQIFLGSDIN